MKVLLIYVCLFFSLSVVAQPLTTIPVYSYHPSPPFVINASQEKGINFDFVHAIQAGASEGLRFEYQLIGRPALNALLAAGKPAVVMWANPAWFDALGEGFLWSKPLFWDKDVIVALKGKNYRFEAAEDLKELRLGGIAGYVYKGIDGLVSRGAISRLDVGADKENIQQLLEGKVDVIIISKSSFLYYARQMQLLQRVDVIGKPHSTFQRHLLVTEHFKLHFDEINRLVDGLSRQPFWRSKVTLLGLQDLWLLPESEQSKP